jgi:hypothetical protein
MDRADLPSESLRPSPGAGLPLFPLPDTATTGTLVMLSPRTQARVAAQAEGFVQSLLAAQIGSEEFLRRRDAALAIGAFEVAEALRLGRAVLLRCCRGVVASAAFRVKRDLREALGELESGRVRAGMDPLPHEDAATRLLRLTGAVARIDVALARIAVAHEDLGDHTSALDEAKFEMRSALRRLRAAACFAHVLQRRLRQEVGRCRTSEPQRARALAAEVLVHAGRRVTAIRAHEAAVANGYLALDPLGRQAEELAVGIERLRAATVAALDIARRLARVTGRQMRPGVVSIVGPAASQPARSKHAGVRAPLRKDAVRIDQLDRMSRLWAAIDLAVAAIDALDELRAAAIGRMVEHDDLLLLLAEGTQEEATRRVAPDDPAASSWRG